MKNQIYRMQQLAGIKPLNEVTIKNDKYNIDINNMLINCKKLIDIYKSELSQYINENEIINSIQSIKQYLKTPNENNWNLCYKYMSNLSDILYMYAEYSNEEYTQNIFKLLEIIYNIGNIVHLKHDESINKLEILNFWKNKIKKLINVESN